MIVESLVFINTVLMLISEIAQLKRNSIVNKLVNDQIIMSDRILSIEKLCIKLLNKE